MGLCFIQFVFFVTNVLLKLSCAWEKVQKLLSVVGNIKVFTLLIDFNLGYHQNFISHRMPHIFAKTNSINLGYLLI